jgi:hypothetical protein
MDQQMYCIIAIGQEQQAHQARQVSKQLHQQTIVKCINKKSQTKAITATRKPKTIRCVNQKLRY